MQSRDNDMTGISFADILCSFGRNSKKKLCQDINDTNGEGMGSNN